MVSRLQAAVTPPSTGRAAPVMKEASSERRKRAAFAISSGRPVRPSGTEPPALRARYQSDIAAEIGTVLRTMVEELAILLKARAAAKVLAKSGNRTMISAVDN